MIFFRYYVVVLLICLLPHCYQAKIETEVKSDGDSSSDEDSSSDSSSSSESSSGDDSSDSNSSSSDDDDDDDKIKKREADRAAKMRKSAEAAAAWTPSTANHKETPKSKGEKSPGVPFTRVDADVWNKEIIQGLEDNSCMICYMFLVEKRCKYFLIKFVAFAQTNMLLGKMGTARKLAGCSCRYKGKGFNMRRQKRSVVATVVAA